MEMEWNGTPVLVVDSDGERRQEIVTILSGNGASVIDENSANRGIDAVNEHQPGLIILDATLSAADASRWQQIRQMTDSPIVILAGEGQSRLIIRAMDEGADDYLTSPVDEELLLLRVWAAMHRTRPGNGNETSIFDDGYLHIDLANRVARRIGEPIKLTATEYALLGYLMGHAGKVCTFEELLVNVWGPDFKNRSQYIHVFVWHLRQKLEPDPKNPTYLTSVHSVGYRFMEANGGNSIP